MFNKSFETFILKIFESFESFESGQIKVGQGKVLIFASFGT